MKSKETQSSCFSTFIGTCPNEPEKYNFCPACNNGWRAKVHTQIFILRSIRDTGIISSKSKSSPECKSVISGSQALDVQLPLEIAIQSPPSLPKSVKAGLLHQPSFTLLCTVLYIPRPLVKEYSRKDFLRMRLVKVSLHWAFQVISDLLHREQPDRLTTDD